MCYYVSGMSKKKLLPKKTIQPRHEMSGKKKLLIKITFLLIGVAAIGLSVALLWTTVQRQINPGVQNGVGANGFRVSLEQGTTLGADGIVSKDQVTASLGEYAKSVGSAQVSKVFNQNGTRRQQLTFDFTRVDGVQSTLFIDKLIYPSVEAIKSDNAYVGTLVAGDVNNHPAYYRRALTIGKFREYSMMVVHDKTVYRLAISQPINNITIEEAKAMNVLKNLAVGAKI